VFHDDHADTGVGEYLQQLGTGIGSRIHLATLDLTALTCTLPQAQLNQRKAVQ
jgi:hypothetical protein